MLVLARCSNNVLDEQLLSTFEYKLNQKWAKLLQFTPNNDLFFSKIDQNVLFSIKNCEFGIFSKYVKAHSLLKARCSLARGQKMVLEARISKFEHARARSMLEHCARRAAREHF